MLNALKYEFTKLRKSKLVIITSACALGFAVFMGVLQLALAELTSDLVDGYIINGVHGLTDYAQNSAIMPFIIAIIVSGVVANDYSHGITRNMIMSGLPRKQIYLSKFIVCTLLGIALFVASVAIHTVILTIGLGFGGGVSFGAYITTLLHILLQYVAFTAFVLLISDLTRSMGAAFGISLGLTLIFTLLAGLSFSYNVETMEVTTNKVMQFIADLYVGNLTVSAADYALKGSFAIKYIITAVVYLGVSLSLGMYLFEKRDIK